MKKTLLFLSCLLFCLYTFAQEGIHLGIGLMPQSTWIFNPRDMDESRNGFEYKATFGYAAVLNIGWNFKDPVGIHLSPTLSMQGQDHSVVDAAGRTLTVRRDQTYLKLPFMLRVNSMPEKAMFSLGFGPSFNILLDADYAESGGAADEGTLPYDPKSLYKSLDMSFAFQMGGDFALGDRIAFNVQIRGDYSLSDVEDKSFLWQSLPVFSDMRGKTKNFTLGVLTGITVIFNKKPKYYCDAGFEGGVLSYMD